MLLSRGNELHACVSDYTVCSEAIDLILHRNDQIFGKTLWKFLTILSTWRRPSGPGVSVDLGVYSPSDGKHTFRDFRFAKGYPYIAGYEFEKSFDRYKRHALTLHVPGDVCPGWNNAVKGEPSQQAKKRTLSMLADSRASHFAAVYGRKTLGLLPQVSVITGLRIRRHYSRLISHRIISKLLEESLTNLKWLRHEKWHDIDEMSQSYFEKGKQLICSAYFLIIKPSSTNYLP